MSDDIHRRGCAELDQLRLLLEGCMARDVPALSRQLEQLVLRRRKQQPIDCGLAGLSTAVQVSRQQVEQRRQRAPRPDYPLALPVVEKRAQILECIDRHQVVILCGETGSGKTTQLPKICLELGRGTRGKIGHTQPRRIAARSLAARIAEELHSPLGEHAGFKVRFHDRVQEHSYVKVMTDGMLLAEIQSDPELREYDTLIIDEAHERSLNIDFLLGCLHRLLPRRPDLKVVITSATIDPERFSRHFGVAPVFEVAGRSWPVETRYRPLRGEDEDQVDRDRVQAVLDAVDELAADGPGDILVFLPGERAIREVSERLRKHHPPQTEILPLFARLSAGQQSQVFRPHQGRRVVLATNVAETSLTVPGIRYVVDTGLARISRYSYRTRVQRLPIEPVSRASANQRAGRCGRVAAGICIRLYDEEDYQARAEFTEPEIQRTSLASVILKMAFLGLGKVEDFPFVDPPDPRLMRDGYRLLQELGAVDERYGLTGMGKQLAHLSVDPRLARMLIAARDLHCLTEVLVIVSALEVVDPRERPLDRTQAADEKHALFADVRSDFLAWLNIWVRYREQARHLSQNKLRKWCREHFLSWLRMREWTEIHTQLHGRLAGMGMSFNDQPADYHAIHGALLTGLLGNIAMRIDSGEYQGARNLRFRIFPGSALIRKQPQWLVAAELVETGKRYLRTVATIDPAWVETLAGHLVKRSYSDPHWEMKRSRVVAFEKVSLYGLPLVSRRKVDYARIDRPLARQLFIRHALVYGEFRTRAGFVQYNRDLLAELDQLESRSRRRDIVIDEEDLYHFFDQRIPQHVCDGASFERWWRKMPAAQSQLLQLDRQQVMRHDAEQITELQFPSQLEFRGLQLALRYHFAPGDANDGLCVQVPLAGLNQLQSADFDWLVPGMLREKIILLIKSLPRQLRRHFVPVPDYADACLQAMNDAQVSLLTWLSDELHRMTGVTVPADAWRSEALPEHLSTCFELIDAHGKLLAASRDLAHLQLEFSGQAESDFVSVSDTRFEREDIQEWDFPALPEFVELRRGGLVLRGYPALEAEHGSIALRVFDQQQHALEAHREGLLALFRRKSGRSLKEVRRCVPGLQKQSLWFSAVADAGALLEDIERAALQQVFMADNGDIRDAETFHARLQAGVPRLVGQAVQIGGWSQSALQAFHDLKQQLGKPVTPPMIAAVGEVREQMQAMIYRGFVYATPLEWLPHLERYLRAAARRLEKLPADPARDRHLAASIRSFRDRYARESVRRPRDAELVRFRWHIEELCVSLFAQELGTSVKVSPERLERMWKG